VTGFPLLDAAIAGDLRLFGSMLEHLWLPLLVLVIANVPLLLKIFIRALERTRVDDITLFRAASGVSTAMLVTSIVRRSLPSMVTMLGMLFGFLVGGAVIIEQLFALPGMGQYLVRAVSRTDYVVIQGFIIIVSAASLFVYFLVDIMNMLLDPRRRTGVTSEGE
jgi:peptide/nickel transport system permease protein